MKRLQLNPVIQMAVALMAAILVFYSCKKDPETPTGSNKILIGATTADTVSYLFVKVTTQLDGTGGNQITQHGHCWSTSDNPNIDNSHTELGNISNPGKFTSDLSGLSDNIKYFIRPYVTFHGGIVYGSKKEIITMKRGKPVAITGTTSDITTTSVKISGSATFDSGFAITQKGITWDTIQNPTILKCIGHSEEGAGTGSFISSISKLTENKQYYFSAYATNERGTSYGECKQFVTIPIIKPTVSTSNITNITNNNATSGGNVTNDGNGTIAARGVCWNTAGNPTLTNCINKTQDGTGTGSYTSQITGLIKLTTYYLVAYATNEKGTAYGNEMTFTTLPDLPTVTTTAVTNITSTTATSGGNASSDGGGAITAKGVCYSNAPNPTLSDSHTTNGSGTGVFVSNLTGLSPNTIYYVRAYATNTSGTAYGNQVSFTTLKQLPTITTASVTNITPITATSGGNVTSDGGAEITARGVCYGTSPNPTLADTHTSNGVGTGVFVSNLTSLTPNTLYYVRAYATNIVGTSYGNEISFTTSNFTLGQSFGGGIIFYIDGTGQHGLIAATSDQSSGAQWGCNGTSIPGTSTAIGTGQANTTKIVNGCSTAGIAARICNDLVLNGYSDWFLPSKDELNQMFMQKTLIGGFVNGNYWSSSEGNAGYAWGQWFYNGSMDFINKTTTNWVRAVRAF